MSLISSTTYAVETINHRTRMVQKQSMTKQDMQAMFTTNKVKVNSLDNGEMAKTEGEWFQFLLPFLISVIGGALSHEVANESGYLHGDQTIHHWPH